MSVDFPKWDHKTGGQSTTTPSTYIVLPVPGGEDDTAADIRMPEWPESSPLAVQLKGSEGLFKRSNGCCW